MKTIIILCICAVAALGAPSNPPPALEFSDIRNERNGHSVRYVTVNGTVFTEEGNLVPTNNGEDHVVAYEGQFQFVGDDGILYVTNYKTDAEGHLYIDGDHLPKPVQPLPVPEVPDA